MKTTTNHGAPVDIAEETPREYTTEEDKDATIKRLVAKLARIETATMKLRGYRAINAHDPAHCIEDAGRVIQDKDATIKRLKDKLVVTAEVMQENIDLKAEVVRLTTQRDVAERKLVLQEDYIETEHIAAWTKIQDALGDTPLKDNRSLCDRAVGAIRERNGLKVEVERLGLALDHTREIANEAEHVAALWHKAEDKCNGLVTDLARSAESLRYYHQFTSDVAKALGWSTMEIRMPDVVNEGRHLRGWKNEALLVLSRWDMVDEFIRKHKDARVGCSILDTVLAWLKERDALKANLETERELREAAEQNITNLFHYAEGREGHVPLSGAAVALRNKIVDLRCRIATLLPAFVVAEELPATHALLTRGEKIKIGDECTPDASAKEPKWVRTDCVGERYAPGQGHWIHRRKL